MKSTFSGDSANLDFVRAAAVLCVFFAHFTDALFRTFGAQPLVEETTWHFGQLGVITFFVHTSLVLMLSLERQTTQGGNFFRDFYIRRAFRIYPLSITCVMLAFFLNVGRPSDGIPWRWPEFIANLSLTQNLFYMRDMWGGLWTLPLEVQMYIALPVLFLIGRRRPLWTVFALWLLALAGAILAPFVTRRLGVVEMAPCFVAGVLGWRLSRSVGRSLPGWLWPLAFVSIWPLFLIASRSGEMYYRWGFCLALGLLIPWFQEMRLGPFNRVAHILAKYSYGIYLAHPALLGAFLLPAPLPVQLLVLAIGMFTVPVILFHTIEQPMINLGRKIATRRSAVRLAPAAVAAGGDQPVPAASLR